MKKILITLTQAVTVKNIMRTGIVTRLLEDPEVELVFLTQHKERIDYYKGQFSFPRTSFIALESQPQGAVEAVFNFLKIYTLRTKTTDLRRRMLAHDTERYLHYIGGLTLNFLLANKIARKFIRALDERLGHNRSASQLLSDEAPDLIVFTNLFDEYEISILREAKRKNIRTVGFINSWDRLTARWTVRLLPDHLIVYNESVKKDAIRHADMPAEKITLTGVPQYDQFFTPPTISKSDFFKQKGLNPLLKLVLVAPMGATFSDSDWKLIDFLHELIDVKKEILSAQMMVRFQPNDFLNEQEVAKRPWLIYDLPGVRFGNIRGGDWDMTEADLEGLNASLHFASVLVTYTSSISIDAAVVGTPVINIDFLLAPVREHLKTPTFYYGTEHHSNAVATGGFRIVKSKEEMKHWINAYIQDPSLDADKRKKLALEQNYKLDGKSAVRIAEAILSAL